MDRVVDQGGLVKQDRRVPQKLFPSNTECCPVKLFELLMSKRPADLCTHGPLYLTPLRKPCPCVWYSVQPVGESKIKTYIKQELIRVKGSTQITVSVKLLYGNHRKQVFPTTK